jgi:hypothetical protein
MKNLFNRKVLIILVCLFIVSVVCVMSFLTVAEVEVDPSWEKGWRQNFELGKRKAEKHAGRKITDEEWEKGWPAYLEVKKKRLEKATAYSESQNIDLKMKGKVVDQYAAPVPEARLEFEIVWNYGLKQMRDEEFAVTDENGLFALEKNKGRWIELTGITSPVGYEYLREHQVGAYFYPDPDTMVGERVTLEGGLEYYDPDPTNCKGAYYYDSQKHVVPFKLWKRVHAKQERLVKDRFGGKVYIGGGWYMVNFFRLTGSDHFSKVADPKAGIDGDILFKADLSEDEEKIILTVAPVQGGVIENPQLSLNAPESGYNPTKTYEFAVASRKSIPLSWIITKSRGDRVYARMRLNISKYLRHEKEKYYLIVKADFLANPVGSRNLEPWGPRDYKKERLAERDWKQVGFDDIKGNLAKNQAKQMSQLEKSYMCQINDGGKYYKGYLSANETFYKYIGTGSDQQYKRIPLIATPANTIEIEPQETMTYLRGAPGDYYAGFVFDDKKLALCFTQFEIKRFKRASIYVSSPEHSVSKLEKQNYEIVEMVAPSKDVAGQI